MTLRGWLERRSGRRYAAMGAALVLACGGPDGSDPPGGGATPGSGAPATAAQPAAAASTADDRIARADFVLCPAIEPIGEELAAMAGFRMDPERGVEVVAGECFVRGDGFLRVALAPAIMQSVAMQASGYDGAQSPLPQLGPQAVLIDAPQPHVVFELRGQIVDVGVEAPGAGRETVVELAERVREALTNANAG